MSNSKSSTALSIVCLTCWLCLPGLHFICIRVCYLYYFTLDSQTAEHQLCPVSLCLSSQVHDSFRGPSGAEGSAVLVLREPSVSASLQSRYLQPDVPRPAAGGGGGRLGEQWMLLRAAGGEGAERPHSASQRQEGELTNNGPQHDPS